MPPVHLHLELNACGGHLEITGFIFEFRFHKPKLMGQYSIHQGIGIIYIGPCRLWS